MKRTLSVILAVIMIFSMLIVSANAVEDNAETTLAPREKPTSAEGLPEVFADGEKFFPEVYLGNEVFYAKYTPEKSGAVVIWSYGSTETFRMIYDEDNMKLTKENSDLLQTNVVDSDGHLGLLYWVDAGKTYIIGVGTHEASLTPESITVWMDFYSYYYDPAPLPPQQTITDANKLPEIFADGKWRGAQVYHAGNAFYRFTPEQSGTIIIWSGGPLETFRMIYDENMNLLELNSDLYSDNFKDAPGNTGSTFNVEAGKTYILGFGMYEIESEMWFCVEYAEQPTEATEPTIEATEPTESTNTTVPVTNNLYEEKFVEWSGNAHGKNCLNYGYRYDELYHHKDIGGNTDWVLVDACYLLPVPAIEVSMTIGGRYIVSEALYSPFECCYGIYAVNEDTFYDMYSFQSNPDYFNGLADALNMLQIGIPVPFTTPTEKPTPPETQPAPTTTSATEPTEPATNPEVKAKKANKMTVTVKDKKVKAKKLKRAKVTVKAITVKKANGAVTFKKVVKKSSNRLKINTKTGKITVKKGTKKGNYKIKVKITAKGTKNYKPKTVTKTVKIKVIK